MRPSPELHVAPLGAADRRWARELIEERWGAAIVVSRGRIHRADELPGFVARLGQGLAGLVTYRLDATAAEDQRTGDPPGAPECEIVTLDSIRPGFGIGSRLIEAVKSAARSDGCRRVWLITTNDNLDALGFYQRRGFELVAVHRGAIARSRMIKPSIPLVGDTGIPIRDEIELELLLS